jgi:hypothetical protein
LVSSGKCEFIFAKQPKDFPNFAPPPWKDRLEMAASEV